MTAYHFVAASEQFLTVEEPLEDVLRERRRNYAENDKSIDFWLIRQPAFLDSDELNEINGRLPKPAAAVVSTDATFITFLKLRLEYVLEGRFEAPSSQIPDALASSVG